MFLTQNLLTISSITIFTKTDFKYHFICSSFFNSSVSGKPQNLIYLSNKLFTSFLCLIRSTSFDSIFFSIYSKW